MIMKNVVVTGGEGFLGRHVLEKFHGRYYYITTAKHQYFDLLKEEDTMKMYQCLLPDVLIHLAASVGGIQYNQQAPAKLLYENTKMGLNVVEYAKRYGRLEKLVCVGSVCMYGKVPPRVPFYEDDIWCGYPEETNSGYGESKRVLLELCKSYRKQYGLNTIFLVPTNLYGIGDEFSDEKAHVVPMLIKRFVKAMDDKAEVVKVWGTGKASREFLYADDCAEAIVEATLNYNGIEPINIGNGKEVSIRDLSTMIAQKVGYKGKIEFDSSMPDGQPRRCLDVSKSFDEFGWKAKTSLSDGLDKTIEWYLRNRISLR